MKIKITLIKEVYNKRYSSRMATVFVDKNRPLDNGGTVLDDLVWRRNHDAPIKPSSLLKALIEQVNTPGFDFNGCQLAYSSTAGCSCPCSPGYIVKRPGAKFYQSLDIWVEIEVDNFDPIHLGM